MLVLYFYRWQLMFRQFMLFTVSYLTKPASRTKWKNAFSPAWTNLFIRGCFIQVIQPSIWQITCQKVGRTDSEIQWFIISMVKTEKLFYSWYFTALSYQSTLPASHLITPFPIYKQYMQITSTSWAVGCWVLCSC